MSNIDLISREALKKAYFNAINKSSIGEVSIIDLIDNAPPVEEMEEPFITECRNTAIEKNLPLYFVYYEETGVFEVYVTKTKELFEKRHCIRYLSNAEFRNLAFQYLDDYSDWKGSME